MTDYNSIFNLTGDGVRTNWEVNFSGGYILPEHVFFVIGETAVPVTFDGASTVVITPAVADGVAFSIQRRTPTDEPLVDFAGGAGFSEANLDKTAKQSVFVAAEAKDIAKVTASRALTVEPGPAVPAVGDVTGDGKLVAVMANKLVAVEPTLLVANYLAGMASMAVGMGIYRSKADATAAEAGTPANAFVQVLRDSTRNNKWSIYQKVGGSLEYVLSIAGTTVEAVTGPGVVVATGVLFDSTVQPFSALHFPSDPSLTVGSTVTFNSATAKVLDVVVKDPVTGDPLNSAFDFVTIEATYLFHDFFVADAQGWFTGFLNDLSTVYRYGGQVIAHPGSATLAMQAMWVTEVIRGYATNKTVSDGVVIKVKTVLEGDLVKVYFKIGADGEELLVQTMQFLDGVPNEQFRLFTRLGVRFYRANVELTALKVTAGFPNAKYGFLGDSNFQGRFVTTYADAVPQVVRAEYPGQVLVAAAPGARTLDWKTRAAAYCAQAPQYTFIMLGTNDLGTGRTVEQIQPDFLDLLDQLEASGTIPIIITCPPTNNYLVPVFNAWLKTLGRRVVDGYAALVQPGQLYMNPAYCHADNTHLITPGAAVLANLLINYTVDEAL